MLSSLTLLFDTIALYGHLSRNESEELLYDCLYLIKIKWLYFSPAFIHMSVLIFSSSYAVVFSIVLEYTIRMIGVDVDYSSGN